MNKITQFRKQYGYLSNFWMSPIDYRGVTFPSVENAYQASKVSGRTDTDIIFSRITPTQAKVLGSKIELRDDWEEIKVDLMETLLRIKFKDETLREKLVSTGDALLYEGNSWNDFFWGVHWETLEGENTLGKLLMKIRDDINKRQ